MTGSNESFDVCTLISSPTKGKTIQFEKPQDPTIWSPPSPAQSQPATLESVRDPRNPNRRVLFPVPDDK